jgi:hypothetical protein
MGMVGALMRDGVEMTGEVTLELRDKYGALIDFRVIKNLVTTAGKTFQASRMAGASAAVMSHVAAGSGVVAAAVGDTALGAELGRGALTSTTPSANTVTYVAILGAGTGTGAVTELGIFNDPTAGTMLARTVFSVVNKGPSDTLAVTWVITNS